MISASQYRKNNNSFSPYPLKTTPPPYAMNQNERKQYLGEPDEFQDPYAKDVTTFLERILNTLDYLEDLKKYGFLRPKVEPIIVCLRGLRNDMYIFRDKLEVKIHD